MKIAHPWLTFKYGEGHSYQNRKRSWSLFLCSVIYFVITSLQLLRLSHSQLHRDSRMYRSGLHFFLYTGSVFRTVPHISISSFHKSGINIISIFHPSLPPLSVLALQHVIFLKIPKRAFPAPQLLCAVLHFLLFSRTLYSTFAIRRSICLAESSTIYIFGEPLLTSGLHAKGSSFIPRQPILFAFRFNRFVFIRIHKCDIALDQSFPCLQLYLFTHPSITHSHRSFHRFIRSFRFFCFRA